MSGLYQKIVNKKLLISCLSISNLIFINSWMRINAFNINNYYPLDGYDLNIILTTLFAFLIFFLTNYFIISYLKIKSSLFFSTYLSLLLILALNSMRSSLNFSFMSLKNIYTLIFFIIIIITLISIIIKKKNLINKFFVTLGLLTCPFFIIIIIKIIFNVSLLSPISYKNIYKPIINKKNYVYSTAIDKTKIVWIIFDQLDSRYFEKEALEKYNLNNFSEIMSNSDYYKKYTPITDETTKEIPSILSGKNFSKYKYAIKEKKIRIKYNDNDNDNYTFWDNNKTIFKTLKKNNLNIYINGWYHPYCTLFEEYYYKCFHTLYGYFTTLKFRGFVKSFLFQFISIFPGYEFLIEKFKINKLAIFTQKGSEFLEAKTNFSNSSSDFLNTLKENKLDFYFLHSSVPHEPFIYNSNKKKLINNYYTEKSSYINNLKLVDKFLGEVIKTLKKNNIFESSVIIAQGDTGIGKDYINSTLEDRIGSTPLLIKKSFQNVENIIQDKLFSNDLSKKINEILFK